MTLDQIRSIIATFVEDTIDVNACLAYPEGTLNTEQAAVVPASPYYGPYQSPTFCLSVGWRYEIWIAVSGQDITAATKWFDEQLEALTAAIKSGELAIALGLEDRGAVQIEDQGIDIGRSDGGSLYLAVIPLTPIGGN